MGQYRPLFVYFWAFQAQFLQKKLKVSAVFELGLAELNFNKNMGRE